MEMMTSWNYRLVTLSILLAMLGSYVALDLAGRMKQTEGRTRRLCFLGGAIAMGLAIYTMHFIGMLALNMDMPVSYDTTLSILSMLAAAVGAGLAFTLINRPRIGAFHFIFGSIAMGLAIATMHYLGMAAMRMNAVIQYDVGLFCLSVVIAIVASAGALWLAFQINTDKPNLWLFQKIGSAVVMGIAISGMHYTGMAAATYIMLAPTALSRAVAMPTVGAFRLSEVMVGAGVIFGIALVIMAIQSAWERQAALEKVQESEKQFLATFEQAAVGIAQVGLNGEWLKLNQKYCEILGYDLDELMNMTFQEVTHPDDLDSDVNLYHRLLNDEFSHYAIEKRYIRKDGAPIWVNLTVSIVRDKNNRPMYSIAVVQDISERKQAEGFLRQNLEREEMAAGIIDSIRAETDLGIVLQQTVNSIGKFMQADRCVIWLYEPEIQQFQTPQYEYVSSSQVTSINHTAFPNVPILPDLDRDKILNFPDISKVQDLDLYFREEDIRMIKERDVKSFLHVPILYKDALLGVLRVHTVFERQEWDEATVLLIQHMAAQVAVAIYHAKTLQELRDAETRKSGILESSLDAIITIDHLGIIREWNASAQRIFGYTRQEAIGTELSELIIPEQYRQAHHNGLNHYLETGEGPVLGQLLELPAIRKDGSEFPAELSIARILMSDPPMFTGTLQDITKRKEAEAEIQAFTKTLEQRVAERTNELEDEIALREQAETTLRQSEERARLLIEAIKDYAIIFLDPFGNVASWNIGAERLTGYQNNEVLGQHFSIFYPPESIENSYPDFELQTAREQGWFEDEGWRNRKGGSSYWANVILTPLRNNQGELIGYSKIVRDLTQRKHLENEIISRTQQLETVNKELEAYSYSVSHDLRAPLRSIDGFSQVVLEEYIDKLDSRGQNYLTRIRQGCQQMAQLIDEMYKLSRLTRDALMVEENIQLSYMALDICRHLQEKEPDRKVTFNIEPDIVVKGDRRLLQVAMENLLDNAWKYTSKHAEAHIEFGKLQSNTTSIYYVKDDGAGFDMRYADKLFGAFQRLHGMDEFSGAGVGLATVSRIIHRHGGEIWAESELEKGAAFFFTLQPINVEERTACSLLSAK